MSHRRSFLTLRHTERHQDGLQCVRPNLSCSASVRVGRKGTYLAARRLFQQYCLLQCAPHAAGELYRPPVVAPGRPPPVAGKSRNSYLPPVRGTKSPSASVGAA